MIRAEIERYRLTKNLLIPTWRNPGNIEKCQENISNKVKADSLVAVIVVLLMKNTEVIENS